MDFLHKKAKADKVKAENAARFTQLVDGIKQEITDLEKISDTGEKYLAFTELQSKIQKHLDEAAMKLLAQADKQKNKSVLTGFGTALGGIGVMLGGITIAGAALPILFTGGIVIYVGGMAKAIKSQSIASKHTNPILLEGTDAFCSAMKTLSTNIAIKKARIIQNDISGIAISRHAQELCDKVPAIKTAFAHAALKEGVLRPAARLDKPAPPPKPQ